MAQPEARDPAPATRGIPLTRLRKGARAVVQGLEASSAHERNKLMALGVLPGSPLRLLQRYPSYVVVIGHTQLALDKETAAAIRVTDEPEGPGGGPDTQ